MLDLHKCTSEDYDEFYPVASNSKQFLDEARKDENRGFYCFDWASEDFLLYGADWTDDY